MSETQKEEKKDSGQQAISNCSECAYRLEHNNRIYCDKGLGIEECRKTGAFRRVK